MGTMTTLKAVINVGRECVYKVEVIAGAVLDTCHMTEKEFPTDLP